MAAGATYEPIASTTLSTTTATITFSSISSAYTDLKIIFVPNGATVQNKPSMRINSDTGTNYSFTSLSGIGSGTDSRSGVNQSSLELGPYYALSSNIPQFWEINLFSYTGSTHKTILYSMTNDQNSVGSTELAVGLWRSTSAINAIELRVAGASYKAGAIATLYGIKAA